MVESGGETPLINFGTIWWEAVSFTKETAPVPNE
jgi:hypothetical protein